jgi:hypothetical protein
MHDEGRRRVFLAKLPALVTRALGGHELRAVFPDVIPGATLGVDADGLRVGDRFLPSALPRITVQLDPAVDVRWLSEAWSIDAPVGVSGDVHQQRWHLRVAGAELPDPYGHRIASHPPTAGRWDLDALLTGRPVGPLPNVSSGASPAYDLRTTGGSVASITVSRTSVTTDLVQADHPASMAVRPADGAVSSGTECVVVAHSGAVLAAAWFAVAGQTLVADAFAVHPDAGRHHAGSALLDVLEAVGLDRDLDTVRLGPSVGRLADAVPFARHGYRADAAGAERHLMPRL